MEKKIGHRKKSLEIFGCQFTDLLVYRRRYWFARFAFQHVAANTHFSTPECTGGKENWENCKIPTLSAQVVCASGECVAYKTTCCHCHIYRPSMALCVRIGPIILLAIETKQKMRKLSNAKRGTRTKMSRDVATNSNEPFRNQRHPVRRSTLAAPELRRGSTSSNRNSCACNTMF